MTPASKSDGTSVGQAPSKAIRRRAPVDRVLDVELFKTLSDPTRLAILACLVKCGRACTVTEVAACCSVDFSVVNRHLALLARSGLLDVEKRGRSVWYAARGDDLALRLRACAEAIERSCPCGDGARVN